METWTIFIQMYTNLQQLLRMRERCVQSQVLCHDPTRRRNISARVTSQLNSLLMSMSSIKIVPDVFVTLSFILGLLKWKYLKRNYLKNISYIMFMVWSGPYFAMSAIPVELFIAEQELSDIEINKGQSYELSEWTQGALIGHEQ